ncbi:Peptide chain release factor 1, mitochondrial [Rhizina undulata]
MFLRRLLPQLHRNVQPRSAYLPRLALRFQSTASSDVPFLAEGLLRRARRLSDEHRGLEKKLLDNYDSKAATRAGQLSLVTRALEEYDAAVSNLQELNSMLADPTLDSELHSLALSDLSATTTSLQTISASLTHSLVPPHPFSHLPALLEIRPGAGGSEAGIFANDLLKMYTTYCANRSWPISMVSLSHDDSSAGSESISEAIFSVDAPGAYAVLRLEAGVHRVQRVPVTEKQGRTHTSTAIVMVLPSFPSTELGEGEEDPDSVIDMKDVRVDIMRARGAGGQHVNTTDSAVRMTHIPTGIVAAIQDSRSQHKNREKALSVLKSRIAERRRADREAEELKMRRGVAKVGAGRSDKLRTYNYSQNRVTDHRCGFSLHDLPGCMDGSALDTLMEQVRKWQTEQDVENLVEM